MRAVETGTLFLNLLLNDRSYASLHFDCEERQNRGNIHVNSILNVSIRNLPELDKYERPHSQERSIIIPAISIQKNWNYE